MLVTRLEQTDAGTELSPQFRTLQGEPVVRGSTGPPPST
jgi:hypothetical protein